MREVMQRLAELTTRFGQNVLADEAAFQLVLRSEADLAGLPDFVRAAARQAASERGIADGRVITLSRSHIVPFLTFSERRDLREQAWRAWTSRGEHAGASDNRAHRRRDPGAAPRAGAPARLRVATPTSRSPTRWRGSQAAVTALLEQVWRPALARAAERARGARGARAVARRAGDDRALGLALLRREGAPGALRPRRGARSSPTSRSSAWSRRRSTAPRACSASASSRAPTSPSTTPTSRSTRCAAPTARRSACSCTTTSPGRPSAAAPG